MKKFIYFTLLIIAQITAVSGANSEFFVRGHVVDGSTNKHIPYATVAVVGTAMGVVADHTGHFMLSGLPVGEHTLNISMVGYVPLEKRVVVKAGEASMELPIVLQEDVLAVDQVVVSADRMETKRKNSPVIVSVITSDLFQEVSAPTLADGLDFVPGVRVEDNCQNCGFTQVRINGLDGHYSQVLVDSRPMFSALTGVYGLEQIPTNMVERVEVVRGGGSALYGASAVGGTINIITKTPDYNSAEVANSLRVLEGGALDNNTTANASFVSDNQKVGMTIFGQVRDRDSYDANGDGYTEIPELNSSTIGLRNFFKTGDYTKLSLQFDHSEEYRRGGNKLWLPVHEADVAEMVEHKINGGGVNFDIFSRNYMRKLNLYTSAQHTHRDSYYGVNEGTDYTIDPDSGDVIREPQEYGQTNEMIVVTGAQFTQRWDKLWFMPAAFVAGVEYNYNDLQDEAIDLDYSFAQTINTYSAYAQNEWRNDKYGFLLGLRADKTSTLDNVVLSPRITARYNPTEKINFRASYSTGFRAPQAFDEDLHIAVVGGEPVRTELADGLKKESSQTYNLSADLYHNFGKVSTNLLIEGFYTALSDVYAIRETDRVASDGASIVERYNASGAKVKGITAEARVVLPRVVSFQGAMTYQSSRYDEPEYWSEDESVAPTTQMFRSPDLYGYLTANVDLTQRWVASLSGTYTGSMLIQHCEGSGTDVDVAVNTPDFFDANLKFTYGFPILQSAKMELSAGVQNIFNAYQSDFDSGFDRDPGYVYGPTSPRCYTFDVKLSF